MLLERREQTTISLAVAVNKTRVIDVPLTADAPIALKSPMVYAGSLFMACIMTVALILFKDMFHTKISSISEVEAIQLPVVETVPLDREQISVTEGKNGLMEESFHRLRGSLRLLTKKGGGKCILITSSTSGGGKNFISINLALSFAFLGCRVLIVGSDIKCPRLAEHFHIQNRQGTTNFLAGSEVEPKSIIYPSGVCELLPVIPSGPVSPNPAKLLERERLEDALTCFRKHFDYIIVDSAPTGLASDTLSLSKVTDFILYVYHINYTYKNVLPEIVDTERIGWLNHISLVISGGNLSEKKYGYGYGCGRTH